VKFFQFLLVGEATDGLTLRVEGEPRQLRIDQFGEPYAHFPWEYQMKHLFLLSVSLLAISACAPQPAPPAPGLAPPQGAYSGSPTNTTTAFDGRYGNLVVTAKTPSSCPDLPLPPYFVINNGFALMQGYNLSFQGFVTPQGALNMPSSFGQTFQGQIDPQFVLRGRVAGPNCAYDMTWSRLS